MIIQLYIYENRNDSEGLEKRRRNTSEIRTFQSVVFTAHVRHGSTIASQSKCLTNWCTSIAMIDE